MKYALLLLIFLACAAEKAPVECPVIGIDLGTTYSCVAVFRQGQVEIIPNELGNRITPSVVAFTDNERLIGESAKNQATINPSRTLYDVKRLIGRKFTDQTVEYDKKYLPFDIVDKDTKPYITVQRGGERKIYAPEEISAMVLSKMKEIAETYLGQKIENAVVTVPAYFNDAQRAATKDAGQIAGLKVQRILNEPTAAAIAYGLDSKAAESNILVFDLGGGTFDVSILTIDGGVFEVISTSGDTHLGGEDFDQQGIDYFVKLIAKKYGKDVSGDKRAIQKLKREIENGKRKLSSTQQVKIEIEDLVEGLHISEVLTRAKFEELNAELFRKVIEPMEVALNDAGLKKKQIDEIVLVGGSSRIPKIRQIVRDFFDGKDPNTGINPDEAICYGAAVQGGLICGETSDATDGIVVIDATPLSLGIETVGGVMNKIIPKGSFIPTKKSQVFSTYIDNQPTVTITVYEGERPLVKDNHKLGSFDLTDLPKMPKGQPQIEVTFEIDDDGILSVSAVEKSTNKEAKTKINNESGRLSKEEIEKMLKEAEDFADQDKLAKERIDSKNSLDSYLYTLKNSIDDKEKLADYLSEEDKKTLKEQVEKTEEWLKKESEYDKEDFDTELKDLQKICDPITQAATKKKDENKKKDDDDDDTSADL
ncbi:Luminal-binding protein 5 [Paramecium bursaria]